MANTWPGLNSSSLAVGPGARGEERRGGREERRWEESRDRPLWASPTSPHFVLMGDKSHSEHKVPKWPNSTRPGQTGSCKLCQRDNVSLSLICAWMPTPWHLVNNTLFLLQTRILFLVSLGTCQAFTVYRFPVCVCECVSECVGQSFRIYLFFSKDKGFTVILLSTSVSLKKRGRWRLSVPLLELSCRYTL